MLIKKIFLYILQNIDFLNIKMLTKKISINKVNQNYLKKILKLNPKIKSGRKNYKQHYKRIIKNILLTKLYKNNLIT